MTALVPSELVMFYFYKCGSEKCGFKFSVEKKAKKDPVCTECGSEFVSHITTRCIEL